MIRPNQVPSVFFIFPTDHVNVFSLGSYVSKQPLTVALL